MIMAKKITITVSDDVYRVLKHFSLSDQCIPEREKSNYPIRRAEFPSTITATTLRMVEEGLGDYGFRFNFGTLSKQSGGKKRRRIFK